MGYFNENIIFLILTYSLTRIWKNSSEKEAAAVALTTRGKETPMK